MRTFSPSLRWAVICVKSTGARVVFGVYDKLIEAERVVSMLARIGCPSNVEAARPTDSAGLERRTP